MIYSSFCFVFCFIFMIRIPFVYAAKIAHLSKLKNKSSEIFCVCSIKYSLQEWSHIQRQIDNVVFNFQVAIVEHKCG